MQDIPADYIDSHVYIKYFIFNCLIKYNKKNEYDQSVYNDFKSINILKLLYLLNKIIYIQQHFVDKAKKNNIQMNIIKYKILNTLVLLYTQ